MALDPLATIDDLEARLGRVVTDEEEQRADALLRDASNAVRKEAGQEITEGESTVRVLARDGKARLSQRPVTSIASVTDVEGNVLGPVWDGLVTLDFQAPLNSFELEPPYGAPDVVDVTYTHGYEEVPEELVAVVCQIVLRALSTPADSAGYTQETTGPFSRTIGPAAAQGGVGMLDDERAIVRRYRSVGGTAWVR